MTRRQAELATLSHKGGNCYPNLRVALGPRVKLAGCKSTLNPPVVYSIDRSKAVVLVLFLLFVALWFPHCFSLYVLWC